MSHVLMRLFQDNSEHIDIDERLKKFMSHVLMRLFQDYNHRLNPVCFFLIHEPRAHEVISRLNIPHPSNAIKLRDFFGSVALATPLFGETKVYTSKKEIFLNLIALVVGIPQPQKLTNMHSQSGAW